MLSKLIKHEFRATGRIMLPMYLILLVTAFGANISGRWMIESKYWAVETLGVLIVMAFGIAVMGACVLSFALMIQRFYKNLLQEEGYLMMTLPVSIHQHLWAKLIVSVAWFVMTVLAIILACMVVAYDMGFLSSFFRELWDILQGAWKLSTGEAANSMAIILEFLVFCFLAMSAFSLQFYAALAIGHSFSGHKLLTSVGCFFALQFATQFIFAALVFSADSLNFFHFLDQWNPSPVVAIHTGMLMMIAGTVVYGAVFYGITTFFLKRRLNLE